MNTANLVVHQNNDDYRYFILILPVCFIVYGWCDEIFDAFLTKVLIKADPVEYQTEQGQIAT